MQNPTFQEICSYVLLVANLQRQVTDFRYALKTKYSPQTRAGLLAHLSRRLMGELIVYRSSRVSDRVSTLSNTNISKTNGSIATKFYLKHHWGGGLNALGFGPDRIRTLVSMATESSHRVIMVKTVSPLFLGCFSSDPFHTCR